MVFPLCSARSRLSLIAHLLRFTAPSIRTASNSASSTPSTKPNGASPSLGAADSTLTILQRKHLGGRIFTFNRPAAFNALTLDMIRIITPQLLAWESSDQCNVIMLRSDHARAFCAGGDVKTLVAHILARQPKMAAQFMKEEYQLNHMIATTPKPFVAICDGITMGGGVGLSVHAPFRVATEKTVLAMPETAIGLFPDVGGTFFLPRLDGELGAYLALTGDRLIGADTVAARLSTHFVPSERISAVTDRLCELEVSDWGVVNAAIEEFAEPIPAGGMALDPHRDVIDRCFKGDSIQDILDALAKEEGEFAKKTLDTLNTMSPLSLHLTLKQIRKGRNMSIAEAFQFEWLMVNNALRHPDFVEGVTAKLLHKPPAVPNWPSITSNMTPNDMDALLTRRKSLEPLPLLRPTTYMEYPHRYLALPSEVDVRRVVRGEEAAVGHFAFMSVDEVVEFFATHWPFRHLVVDAMNDLRAMKVNAAPMGQTVDLGPNAASDLEVQVGTGKIGVREHVRAIVGRCCSVDPENGVKWTWLH